MTFFIGNNILCLLTVTILMFLLLLLLICNTMFNSQNIFNHYSLKIFKFTYLYFRISSPRQRAPLLTITFLPSSKPVGRNISILSHFVRGTKLLYPRCRQNIYVLRFSGWWWGSLFMFVRYPIRFQKASRRHLQKTVTFLMVKYIFCEIWFSP